MDSDRNNRATALFGHIQALEWLQEAKDEAGADFNERKALAKEDGFDTNVLGAILKRRKNGEGQTRQFDEILQDYELQIEQQERAAAARSEPGRASTNPPQEEANNQESNDMKKFDDTPEQAEDQAAAAADNGGGDAAAESVQEEAAAEEAPAEAEPAGEAPAEENAEGGDEEE